MYKYFLIFKFVLFLFLLILIYRGHGQNHDTLFSIANDAYKKGNYMIAGKIYEELIDDGNSAPEIHYNLGNVHYKLNNYPMAILNYERALKQLPRNKSVKHNLQLARSALKEDIVEQHKLFIIQWWKLIASLLPTGLWVFIHILFFILFIIMTGFFLVSSSHVKKLAGFRLGITFFVFSFFCCLLAIQSHYDVMIKKEAIVINDKVTARSGPGLNTTALGNFHAGTKVRIINSTDDWYEIKTPDGNVVWLSSYDIVII